MFPFFFLIIHVINVICVKEAVYFKYVVLLHMLPYSCNALFSISIVFIMLYVVYQQIIRYLGEVGGGQLFNIVEKKVWSSSQNVNI